MARWLRALGVLAEDLGLVPSTYMVVHNNPYLQFRCSNILPLLTSVDTKNTCGTHTYIYAGKPLICIK